MDSPPTHCTTPSNSTHEAPQYHHQRLEKMCSAVKTLLECVDEDPEREGLRKTPMRFAKSLLFFTKGYRERVEDVVNGRILDGMRDGEMVVVRDIGFHSLCEHHLVPFSGKVGSPQWLVDCMCVFVELT